MLLFDVCNTFVGVHFSLKTTAGAQDRRCLDVRSQMSESTYVDQDSNTINRRRVLFIDRHESDCFDGIVGLCFLDEELATPPWVIPAKFLILSAG